METCALIRHRFFLYIYPMNRSFTLLFILCLFSATKAPAQPTRLTDYVNPFVGTDFTGHTYPGAAAPFGMVQLSPDTRLDGWEGCSGYHYRDSLIYGFSHTHLSGTGVSDYGDVLFMPVVDYQKDFLDHDAYRSPFRHEDEQASPGYYRVFLQKPQVTATLTAGERMGMHRYTYPKNTVPQLIIDLQHRDQVLESSLTLESPTLLSGMRRSVAWSKDQSVYFYAEFSLPVQTFTAFGDRGALLTFAKSRKGQTLQVKVGISSVSVAGAKANLYAEKAPADWNFEALRQTTQNRWERYLGKIDVRGSNASDKQFRTFYTALYHTALAPNLYSDVDGAYRGMDRQVHRADSFDRYTVFSLWDTFRALHPLFALIERERTVDFIKTFESIYDQAGKLPVWELAGYETDCMIGYHSVSVIADALAKGIDNFPVEKMLEAMVASANKKEYGIDAFRAYGFVPAEIEHESVSKTLEYAYDDWCIAQTARYLYRKTGRALYDSLAGQYDRSALYYRNLVDPETHFMRARMDGRWYTPFRPEEVNNHYTEANSWQYSFFAPQDIEGHIALLGGDGAYCRMIDKLFEASDKTSGRVQLDITGQIGQYAHGNEPSHHVAYLYAYAGQSWKTQQRVRQIMTHLYSDTPDGLCGNEDCGQMSAWYVLSAIGLYTVTPGSSTLVFGSPLFDHVVIHLENGREFTLSTTADGSVDACPYIQSVSLNGKNHTRSWIDFARMLEGGTLSFRLGPNPNYSFGSAPEDRPHSALGRNDLVISPWFRTDCLSIYDSVTVALTAADPAHTLYLKVGDAPYRPYTGAVTFTEPVTLWAYAATADGARSFPVSSTLYKVNTLVSIKLLSQYSEPYSAGGPEGLIDRRRGTPAWRTGGWQGYQGTDFTAILDLKSVQPVSHLSAGFCQEIKSWIWMPRYVEYSLSTDGETFTPAGRIDNTVDIKDYTPQVKDFALDLPVPANCRYVKIHAKNFGTIPSWHLGAGGEGYIFVDEVEVK